MGERRVEYLRLADIVGWDRNPKDHDVGAIILSIRRFGFQSLPLVNEQDGVLLAGHGRLKALRQMQIHHEPLPDGLRGDTDDWLVPVVHGSDLSPDEADAYRMADNRLTELGGWHEEERAQILSELASKDLLLGTGWSGDDVDALLRDLGLLQAKDETFDVGAALEAEVEPRIKRGEVWQLGRHRLMCGDATDPGSARTLIDGEQIGILLTDPPYGIELDHTWRDVAGANLLAPARQGVVAHDDRADWIDAWKLFEAPIAYVWHSALFGPVVFGSLGAAGFEVRQQLIWVKTVHTLGRSAYQWKHECCWYAVRKGHSARWIGGREATTVWYEPSPLHIMSGSQDDRTSHPTQKPLVLFEEAIANHRSAGVVVDPFLGSGTTLIAAEKLGRVCYGMEIEPRYCEVAIQRWEDFTDEKAVRVNALS